MSNYDLVKLGTRICIIGPSCSGKSTLANKLANKLNIPVFHLDQMAHKPNTNWERRSNDEFIIEHDQVILQDAWIIDGNYSICMEKRFSHATAVIWIEIPFLVFLWRYFYRSIRSDKIRYGKLEGAKREFGFKLIKYTLFNYPKNKKKYAEILKNYDIPVLRIDSINNYILDK